MAWQIAHAESFPLDLARAPKKVRNAWQRTVLPILRDHPDTSDPPTVKKLKGFKSLWRLRVSDQYRLVYRVEPDSRTVILLLLDNRSKVYDRAGISEDEVPTARIVANASDLLEREPTDEQVGVAEIAVAAEALETPGHGDRQLNRPVDEASLEEWGVPEAHWPELVGLATEDELMEASSKVPEEVMERVLNGLWPPTIEDVTQEPVRVAHDPEDILDAAEGGRELESFLLRLDEEQMSFVGRFDGPNPKGPWLLKGGPGSGKSTVALYCIASLVRKHASQLPLDQGPIRILFTTYTHSLTNAATHLLESMEVDVRDRVLEVVNVDRLVGRDVPTEWRARRLLGGGEDERQATDVLAECLLDDKRFGFSRQDVPFLIDEIDWVIVGQDIETLDQYLNDADRAGRGRALVESQRRQVWKFWTRLESTLERNGKCLFSQRFRVASHTAKPRYDYVFIDEAQDLKPVAIRYCVRLCRNGSNVFLTADSNQSIYGTGMSWARVAEDLSFTGRAKILKRNYRTTQEIWEAIAGFAPEGGDSETLAVDTVFRGSYPTLYTYRSPQGRAEALGEYLKQALLRERLPSSCAAVMCPTYAEARTVAASLPEELEAKPMRSKDTDLSHRGVKVLTMHAAKGLQFPVVAVTGLQARMLPKPMPSGKDPAEHDALQRRLLFVACSRAMRHLALFAPIESPSPYVEDLSDEAWELVEVD